MFIKKSEFEELKKRIEIIEFKQENPLGMAIIKKEYGFCMYDNYLKYIKDNELKEIYIGDNYQDFELDKNGNIIEKFLGKQIEYKFDIDREILIQLKEIDILEQYKKGIEKKYNSSTKSKKGEQSK